MTKVVPIQLEDGTLLYIEGESGTEAPAGLPEGGLAESGEQRRTGAKGLGTLTQGLRDPSQSMAMVQSTIRAYTQSCLSAFKGMNVAHVSEVTLEFGVNISADAGIPYIAGGKAQSNLKITVKCAFDQKDQKTDFQPVAEPAIAAMAGLSNGGAGMGNGAGVPGRQMPPAPRPSSL